MTSGTQRPKLILIGGGGHCLSCIDVIEAANTFEILGILDLPSKKGQSILSHSIIGCDEDIPRLAKKGLHFLITLGQIKTPSMRIKLYQELVQNNASLATVISPLAYVSPYAQVAPGTIVMHHAFINAGASVQENCIINTKALIEHESTIEPHCHISTAAVVNGGTRVHEGSLALLGGLGWIWVRT